ncbi:MAG: AMP-binding protein [Gammaproteobacteria bacterium]|nr:AMP-binding protein [Gammaproteobacteria bacterium]
MEKVWLKQYQTGVPAEINNSTWHSLVEMFEQSVKQFGDKPAFRNFSSTLTYREVDQHALNLSTYLQSELGLKKGDRIALMLPNLLQYPVAFFAALRAGLVVVNINPMCKAAELSKQLDKTGASVMIVLANFADTVEQALAHSPLKRVIITEVGDCFISYKRMVTEVLTKYVRRMIPKYKILIATAFRQALAQGAAGRYRAVELDRDDVALLQFTGGTTGEMKAAMLTHGSLLGNIHQLLAWVKPIAKVGEEAIITPLPLYHIFSLLVNMLLFIPLGGLNLLVTNPRDIPSLIKVFRREHFTAITGVNTLFNALMHHSDFDKIDFEPMHLAISGGMATQHAVAQKWQELTERPLLQGYGLTEASPVVAVPPLDSENYNGSIGVPLPSTDVKIIDSDGDEMPLGEPGELCIHGPQVMKGYWRSSKETQEVLSPRGWLKTGDIVRMDEKGFLYIVDRKKDMIIVSGFNVYPNEVEDVLAEHPGIKEVAIVGMAGEKESGEKVAAYIVKESDELTKEEITAFCREKLSDYKRPRYIEFCDDLPKNEVGKVLRRELKQKKS